jgi:Uncharacterized protein conserved in bacteria (DUF2330)
MAASEAGHGQSPGSDLERIWSEFGKWFWVRMHACNDPKEKFAMIALTPQTRLPVKTLCAALLACCAASAQAFCGFYAGKADASLFNEASQVVVVRDGPRTVLSMLNDYKGPLNEFALVAHHAATRAGAGGRQANF